MDFDLQGKHLVSLFKEAKAAYKDKKAVLEQERSIKRSYPYDVPARGSSISYSRPPSEQPRYYHVEGESLADEGYENDEIRSRASLRSRRSDRTRRSKRTHALTEANLERLSEFSSTAPPRNAPPGASGMRGYRPPYAETMSKSMVLSRPDLARAPAAPKGVVMSSQRNGAVYSGALDPAVPPPPGAAARDSMDVNYPSQVNIAPKSRSDPSLMSDQAAVREKKEIDMNLAYGSVPPDLAQRVDLDPNHVADCGRESQAHDLVDKIEGLLDEAECMHHSASTMIQMLQDNPERAAAVALALAELSGLLGKMAPAFAGFLKTASPAVFGLLASPQFLIAAGVAVGVTIVMFGGWKIIKKINQAKSSADEKMAVEMTRLNIQQAAANGPPPPVPDASHDPAEADHCHTNQYRAPTEATHDDALVLEEVEELSHIEQWVRGIEPFGSDDLADMELISPGADKVIRRRYEESRMEFEGDDATVTADDSVSRVGRSSTSRRSHHHHHRHHPGSSSGRSSSARSSPAGTKKRSKSHVGYGRSKLRDEVARSEAVSNRGASSATKKTKRESGKSKSHAGDGDDAESRHSSARSDRTSHSRRRRSSEGSERKHRTRTIAPKAIEDGSKDRAEAAAIVGMLGGGKKEKKDATESSSAGGSGRDKEKAAAGSMLKALFRKKKEREEEGERGREQGGSSGSGGGGRLVMEIA